MSGIELGSNPLVNQDRRLGVQSCDWVQRFDCSDMKPLIICRGPIRKEAMDVFSEMGLSTYGILLSEKDSVTYPQALAPELRSLTDPTRVHRVQDYSGVTKEERQERIFEIISIAHTHGYDSIFAGYGFMSEDADMVSSMERAGLIFIGPGSHVQSAAGLKDEAKRTAATVDVSVTPGIDDATSRAILKKAPTLNALLTLAKEHEIEIKIEEGEEESLFAARLLDRAHDLGIDIYTIEELVDALYDGIREMFFARPHVRIRLKAISGGGGKGQRIIRAPQSYSELSRLDDQIDATLASLPSLVREILSEVKCLGVGDNKNVVAELNVEETSHQEIQVIGNGEWCLTMGGRDCSLQMHEQKLLEISVIEEELLEQIDHLPSDSSRRNRLESSLTTLRKMESEATRFGLAVGLDSVSTFECIVSGDEHYFMEMNTRIQVEHRVTELCYTLRFTNPNHHSEYFEINSLVELMVVLARHKRSLPKPTRVPRYFASVEARINATNDALKPHAGGVILDWSEPLKGEIRDDQGISSHNPDTGAFMRYHLAGAYDSNIALLLTVGGERLESYKRMAEVFRLTKLEGDLLCTNLHFHYGLIHWFLARDIYGRVNTKFVAQYLAAVGALAQEVNRFSLEDVWLGLKTREQTRLKTENLAIHSADHIFDTRFTLVTRPIKCLLASPHLLSGWLSIQSQFLDSSHGETVRWRNNPLKALSALYHFLNLEYREGRPALQQIWDHDDVLLQRGLSFYEQLGALLGEGISWQTMCEHLKSSEPPKGVDEAFWVSCQAAHHGHQLGLNILSILEVIGGRSGFSQMSMDEDGGLVIPAQFRDPQKQGQYTQVLAPPPVAKAGELVAVSGGMFYPREAPDQPKLIELGEHFEVGQALYIIEVMKMFNKVYAPFSGTITEVLIEGEGVIIKKGQPLFKVKPDYEAEEIDEQTLKLEQSQYALELLQEVTKT